MTDIDLCVCVCFTAKVAKECFPKHMYIPSIMGRDSSVGIAARYGLDGAWTESRWGRDFRQIGPGAHQASYKMGIESLSLG